MDNALPHLESQEEMVSAIREMASLIAPGGLFLASVRDYDSLLEEKPSVTDIRVFGSGKDRRIVFQVWDWRRDDRGYRIHQYIVRHLDEGEIETRVFTTTYWAWKRRDLEYILNLLDLEKSDWLEPKDTGFFQPILMARKTA